MQKTTLIALLTLAAAAVAPAGLEAGEERLAHSTDLELERINERVPGFGGMYFEGETLKVFLRDPAQAPFFESLADDVEVLRGRFEFRTLTGWRADMRDLLALEGIETLDVDESLNRVRVGIRPGAKRAAAREIRRRLDAAGIPRSAVRFSRQDPIYEMQTVQDFVRPVPGGVQINFPGFLCTLGFNVELGAHCYFVTNDHCTAVSGQNDSTPYYQPLSPDFIGTEVLDPPFFTGAGCFPGSRCRFSDAAAARYDNAGDCEFGKIARTPVGSLVYDTPDRWTIVSKQLAPILGQLVAKQGRTTGRTEGRVTATCVDTGVSGSNIVRLCQAFVENNGQVVVQGGDSGSPVFRRRVATSQAQLVGILWGGNGPGTQFVYSPMENIETDFGRSLPVF